MSESSIDTSDALFSAIWVSSHPYPKYRVPITGQFTSLQRPILRGQARFCGQGAVEAVMGRGGGAVEAEDKHVFERYFSANGSEPMRRNGTYVEMGAFNGVTFSNTLFFERELGWTGLLAEANPRNFALLRATRGRTGANTLLHAAACEAGRSVRVAGTGSTSKTAAANDALAATASDNSSKAANETVVPCMPLRTMLRRAGLRRVDLFSLDARGPGSTDVPSYLLASCEP